MKCPGTTDEHCLHPARTPGAWSCCRSVCTSAGGWTIGRGAMLEPNALGLPLLGPNRLRLAEVDGTHGCQARDLLLEFPGGGAIWRDQSLVELALPATGGVLPSARRCRACGAPEGNRHEDSCPRLAAAMARTADSQTVALRCTCPRLFADGHVSGCPEKRPPRHVLG